jgi:hypothetical protein
MRQAQQALYEMSDSLTGIEDLVTRLIHATRDPEYKPSRRDRERRTGKAYQLHPDGSVAREKIRETCENFYIVQKQRATQLRTYDKLDARIRKTQARPKGPITTGGKDGPNKIIRALLSPEMIRKVRSFADSVGIGAGSTQAQRDAMMEDAQFASLRNIAEANAKAQKRHSFGNTDAYGNPIPDGDGDDGDDENRYTEATGGQGGQGGGSGASGDAWKPPMLYTEEPAAAPYNNGAAPFQQQFPPQQYPPQFQQQQFQQFPQQQFQQLPQQQQFPQQQFQQQHQFPQQQFQQQHQFPQQQFQQLPQQFHQLPYANQGPGYYDQGQDQGHGQGPLTFTQKFTKLVNDVMGSQIGRFIGAALATLVVYLIVCAFLTFMDKGTWVICRLYDYIVVHVFQKEQWKQLPSNAQIAEVAGEAFKTSDLYKLIPDQNKTRALEALTTMMKETGDGNNGDIIRSYIGNSTAGARLRLDATVNKQFFEKFFAGEVPTNDAVWNTPASSIKAIIEDKGNLADALGANDALRFLVPTSMKDIAEDTTAMTLLYTPLVMSTFLYLVGARKRLFIIPAASVALFAMWLRGGKNTPPATAGPELASSYEGIRSELGKLKTDEKMFLMMVISSVLTLITNVVAGESAKGAASKATFELTHDLKGEINLRRDARRLQDQAMAGVYAHPYATLFKAGTEAAGFRAWY